MSPLDTPAHLSFTDGETPATPNLFRYACGNCFKCPRHCLRLRAKAPSYRDYCLRMIMSENRCPRRIKSGTGFFGILR
jgi:hypothetical protein